MGLPLFAFLDHRASTNSARRPVRVEEDERVARAERAARTLTKMSTLKRKTYTNTKKGKK